MAETIDQTVALTDAERKAVERLRMTPEQRRAELAALEQAALERLPAEIRQAREARAAQLASMTTDQRRVYHLGQHLVAVVRMLREEARRGATVADVLGSLDAAEADALAWFLDQVQKPRAEPVQQAGGGRP